jgi:hypothetical protein
VRRPPFATVEPLDYGKKMERVSGALQELRRFAATATSSVAT